MYKPTLLIAGLVLAAACTCAQVTAPASDGTRLSGKVTDVAGTPLVGISVTVKNLKTGEHVTVVTDKAGRFTATGLEQGGLSVSVEPLLVSAAKGIRLIVDSEKTPSRRNPKK